MNALMEDGNTDELLLDDSLPLSEEEFEQFMEVGSDMELFSNEDEPENELTTADNKESDIAVDDNLDKRQLQSSLSNMTEPLSCSATASSSLVCSHDEIARGDYIAEVNKDEMVVLVDSKEMFCSQVRNCMYMNCGEELSDLFFFS